MRPEGLIAGGCSSDGGCEGTACGAGVGCVLFGEENREGRFVSDCRGREEAICGGTVTEGGLKRGASDVLEPVVRVGDCENREASFPEADNPRLSANWDGEIWAGVRLSGGLVRDVMVTSLTPSVRPMSARTCLSGGNRC